MQDRSGERARAVVDVMRGEPPPVVQVFSRRQAPLGDHFAFIRGFLAHPKQVGSVVPSSRTLEQRLIRDAEIEHAKTIVELGPGTGGTTRALLRAMRPDAHLLAVELSSVFHARLISQFSDARLSVQLGSADDLPELLEAWRLPAPDVVISGIPFSTMPEKGADSVAARIAACLAPGGRFVAYQFRAHVERYLRPYLGEPDRAWEWRNVPPLRVFRWIKAG